MNAYDKIAKDDGFGVLTEPATLRLVRLLPGRIDRVWAYLTDSELRSRWLAAGTLEQREGAPLVLVWRNDELTDPPGQKPEGFGAEHSLESRVIEIDPPHLLTIAWGQNGEVVFELEERGSDTLLTLTHRRLRDLEAMLNVGPGWHAHLDVLVARVADRQPAPFWDEWSRLKVEYTRRLAA